MAGGNLRRWPRWQERGSSTRQKRGTYVRPRSAWNLLDADVIRWRMAGGDGERLMRDLTDVRSVVKPPPPTAPRSAAPTPT